MLCAEHICLVVVVVVVVGLTITSTKGGMQLPCQKQEPPTSPRSTGLISIETLNSNQCKVIV
jgi:hypothetical protein